MDPANLSCSFQTKQVLRALRTIVWKQLAHSIQIRYSTPHKTFYSLVPASLSIPSHKPCVLLDIVPIGSLFMLFPLPVMVFPCLSALPFRTQPTYFCMFWQAEFLLLFTASTIFGTCLSYSIYDEVAIICMLSLY